MDYYILAVYPGSTTTKMAVYKNEELLFTEKMVHPQDELDFFEDFYDQHSFRSMVITDALSRHNFDTSLLSCVVGRGGKLTPVNVGGYEVSDDMIDYFKNTEGVPVAANLGCMVARDIAEELNIPAYIYDAFSACTLPPEANVLGIPEIEKRTYCHVLNSRAAAYKYAEEQGKKYEDIKAVVVHLGAGVSVSAHYMGKIVAVAGDDESPLSAERAGKIPPFALVELCYSGRYTRSQINKKIMGGGGIKAYMGTSNMEEVEKKASAGDEKAKLICDASILQISQEIGSVATAVKGDVEAVILTGGVANSKMFTDKIASYVSYIAPVVVYPGGNELNALAMGALRILRGEEEIQQFVM